MPSNSDDDPVMRSSTERYDRVGVSLRWPDSLVEVSSIFFGFLLRIAYTRHHTLDYLITQFSWSALYAVTVAGSHVHPASYLSRQ